MEPGKHHRLSHQSDSSVSDAAPARRRGGVRALGILRTVASHRIKDNHGTPYREKKPELGTASTYVPNNTCNAAKSPRRAIHLQPSARNANAVPRTNAVAIPVRGSIWRRDARSHALVTVMAMISAPSIQHPASSIRACRRSTAHSRPALGSFGPRLHRGRVYFEIFLAGRPSIGRRGI
jgi:hypothetical protein